MRFTYIVISISTTIIPLVVCSPFDSNNIHLPVPDARTLYFRGLEAATTKSCVTATSLWRMRDDYCNSFWDKHGSNMVVVENHKGSEASGDGGAIENVLSITNEQALRIRRALLTLTPFLQGYGRVIDYYVFYLFWGLYYAYTFLQLGRMGEYIMTSLAYPR